jgi:hypothetical protein
VGRSRSAVGNGRRGLLVGALTLAAVPLVGASPALACSCTEASDAAHFDRAEVVFKGTLPEHLNPGPYEGVVTFAASRVYKGAVSAREQVETGISDASCGWQLHGPGPYLVFGSTEGGEVLEANLCSGTRKIGASDDPPFGAGTPVAQTGAATVAREPDGRGPWSEALPIAYAVGGAGLLALLVPALRRRRPG